MDGGKWGFNFICSSLRILLDIVDDLPLLLQLAPGLRLHLHQELRACVHSSCQKSFPCLLQLQHLLGDLAGVPLDILHPLLIFLGAFCEVDI